MFFVLHAQPAGISLIVYGRYGRDDNKIELHTSDHDDTNASILAELNGASDFFTRGIQHTNTANEGQVSLRDTTGIKQKGTKFNIFLI